MPTSTPEYGSINHASVKIADERAGRDPLVLCSLVFVVAVAAAGFLAPWISPDGAGGFEEKQILETPSWAHLMGTDGSDETC